MEKTLKQNEIDALFQAALSSTPEAQKTEVRARVVPYNFSSAGQISTDQLRAISMLNDLFARNLTHNLAAWLRTRFQVNLVSAEQIPFNEFLLRIPEISYVASVRMEPLGALAVLQLDLALAPPIIDLLLGGEGRDGAAARADRHRGVDSGQRGGDHLPGADRGLAAGGAELQLRAPPDADPGGAHHVGHGKDALPELRDSHAAQLGIAQSGLSGGGGQHHSAPADLGLGAGAAAMRGETRARMEAAARRIRFGGSLQLPTVRLAASAIENLEPGTVLRLDLAANTLAEWRVGGQTLSLAQAIRQGAHRAARIERPVDEAES